MGCWYSKSASKSSLNINENGSRNVYSWDLKPQINPQDYIIENVREQLVVRPPQSVNGQQFIVQNCHGNTFLVLDHINTVTVDDCTDCIILLGPIQGSLFVRDCHRTRIMAACQQFRARDCTQLDVFLCVPTQPIIESCADIHVGCYHCSYPALKEQFEKANLSVFSNQWYNVYDFTPLPHEKNWSILDKRDVDLSSFSHKGDNPATCVDSSVSLVPWTPSLFSLEGLKKSLVFFFHDSEARERAMRFVGRVKSEKVLLRTMEIQLEPQEWTRTVGAEHLGQYCRNGPMIVLLFAGNLVPDVTGLPPSKVFVTHFPQDIDSFLLLAAQKTGGLA